MKNITIFCASSNNVDRFYLESVYNFGKQLAINGFNVYYGGGNIGLMGKLADGAISKSGNIYGIIPNFLVDMELEHQNITKSFRVNSMHERQEKLMKNADIIVALPGGIGTFTELFEAITWRQLGLIHCPIYIVNINNYFEPLILLLKKAIDEGFMRIKDFDLYTITSNIDETITKLCKNKDVFINYDMA